jgi:CheY-like chemotaxis protein
MIYMNTELNSRSLHGKKVLIIEDDLTSATAAAEITRELGMNADIAYSIDSAFNKQTSHDYDCVLLDLMMPGADGLQYLNVRAKNKRLQNIPVIVVSSLTDSKVKEQCFQFDVGAFIEKPVNARLLKQNLSVFCD